MARRRRGGPLLLALLTLSACQTPMALRPEQASLRARSTTALNPRGALHVGDVDVIGVAAARSLVESQLGLRARGHPGMPRLDVSSRPKALEPLRSTVAQARPRHGRSSGNEGSVGILAGARRGGAEAPKGEPGVLLEARVTDGERLVWLGELWVPRPAYDRCPLVWLARLLAELGAEREAFLEPTCPRGAVAR